MRVTSGRSLSALTPKNRYKTPSRIADRIQRLRHIGCVASQPRSPQKPPARLSTYLQYQQLEGSDTRPHYRLGYRFVHHLNGSLVSLISRLFSNRPGFPPQQHRRVGLRDEKIEQEPIDARPHHQNIEAPSPALVARNEATDNRTLVSY